MSESEPEPQTKLTIDIEKLGVLNQLGELGVEWVERRLGKLSGEETAVESELVKSGYVTPETLDLKFDEERRIGVAVRVRGAPHGSVLVLFPTESAKRAVMMMLADADEEPASVADEMAVSALVELGGIMANGFLDGLADTFDQHIDAGTPSTINDTKRHVIARVLDREQNRGLYLATTLHITTHDVEAEVYLFPENDTFVRILNLVDMDMVTT
ncbi:MAG: chemotaxis protein CheC [Halobacteriota archaeon]